MPVEALILLRLELCLLDRVLLSEGDADAESNSQGLTLEGAAHVLSH
jgi:hypothetical protein